MDLMNLLFLAGSIIMIIEIIIIPLAMVEQRWSPIERMVGKKLRVIYYPNRSYKLVDGNGMFIGINNTEYSYLYLLVGSEDVSCTMIGTITMEEYDVEICYGKKDPALNILSCRYKSKIFDLIFKGKFLPKHKCVFHVPSRDAVCKGKFVTPIAKVIVPPKSVPILIPE